MDERFEQVDRRFDRIEGHVTKIEGTMVTKDEFESRLNKFEATMVTKDYLDRKLAEESVRFGGVKGANRRIDLLTDALVKEGSLSAKAAKAVASAGPFVRG